MITVLAVVAGIVSAWLLFKVLFDDIEEFLECVRYSLTPDIISLFRGEWGDDKWAEMKLYLYLGLSAGSGFAVHYGLSKFTI